MKKLIIVRHAKAVPYGYQDDFSRELTDRGESDAGKVSRALEHAEIVPEKLYTSPASRALMTARIFAESFRYPSSDIQEVEALYMEFTTAEFIDFITRTDDRYTTVAVFGHNPGVSYFADNLIDRFGEALPTCGTVVIEFNIESWRYLQPRSGRLLLKLYPKELR